MESTDIEKYSAIMKEIKLRVALANSALATKPEDGVSSGEHSG